MDLLNSEFHFDRLDPWQPAGQQDAIQHSQAAEQEAVAAGHLLALLAHIAAGGQNLQAATMYRKPEAAAFRSQQEAEGTIWGHPPPPRFHPVAVKFGNAAGQSTGVTALGLSGRDPRLAHLLMAPAVHPPSEQLAQQQPSQGAWPRQVPAMPKLSLAGAASNVAGLHPDGPDRIRSRLQPVPSMTVPLSSRDPRLLAGTPLRGRVNPGNAASSASWISAGTFNTGHGWLPQLPPAGHRFYPSQLLSAPAQQQAASRALPHRADDSFAGRPGPANSPLQLFTTHLDPQAHHPDSARGNSSFTNTWLSFSDCEQPVNSTSSRGSPLVAQDAEPQESAWEPQVFLSEPGLGQLADQRGSAGQPEGSGTDPPALEAVAVAVSLVGDIPEWPLEGPAAELPAAGSSGPFNAPEAARPPTDTQLLRRILHREAQAAAPEATQPVPEDGSGPQASDLLWLAHVVAAHSILSLASAGQPGLAGPEPEPAEQAAPSRGRERRSTLPSSLTAASQLRLRPPRARPSKPDSALPASAAKRRKGPAPWSAHVLQGGKELTPAREPCKQTKRSHKRSWSVQLQDADWRAQGREWAAPTAELPQAKRRRRTAKEELMAASNHGQSYRCPVCETAETPLWRWEGDLLLCNACGLRRRQAPRRRSSRGRKRSAGQAVPVAATLPADGVLPGSHAPLEEAIRHTRQPSRPSHASRPAHHVRRLLSNDEDWHIDGSDSPSSSSSDSGARGVPAAGPGPTQMASAANLGSGHEFGSRDSSFGMWPRRPDKHRDGGSAADRTASLACSGGQESADKLQSAVPGISLVWGLRRKRSFWI